jgi:hypothetical protein
VFTFADIQDVEIVMGRPRQNQRCLLFGIANGGMSCTSNPVRCIWVGGIGAVHESCPRTPGTAGGKFHRLMNSTEGFSNEHRTVNVCSVIHA